MVVQLFTVRIVLNTLGVVDYGIFSVVGGVVTMFAFLSNTMSSASQRFFAFELGKNDLPKLKKTFNITMLIYIIIASVVLILAETLGLWFVNSKFNIPDDRMNAANWIYQFSVLGFIVTILRTPYNAVIIAREQMSVYAIISIFEVFLKLLIVYLLVLFPLDKLKLYAVLLFLSTALVSFIYYIYCVRKFEETRYKYYWDRNLFNTLISYSGWNLFGALSNVFNNQGINIVLNIFFGPILNTARGIAASINTAINQFVTNFHVAVKPQITKYYASHEREKMVNLVFFSSKISFFLLLLLSLPILFEANFILTLWLKNIPEYVILFARLIIINALIDSLTYAMQTAVQATGRIKLYQIVVGGMLLLNLPISYISLKLGFPPETIFYISIFISIICLFLRLLFLRKLLNISISSYLNKVLFKALLVTFVALTPTFIIHFKIEESGFRILFQSINIIIVTISAIYFLGLEQWEKLKLKSYIRKKIK